MYCVYFASAILRGTKITVVSFYTYGQVKRPLLFSVNLLGLTLRVVMLFVMHDTWQYYEVALRL